MSEPDEAAIARLLAEHPAGVQIKDAQDLRAACRGCPWVGPWRQSTLPATRDHRAHVAAVIVAHMADREADAAWACDCGGTVTTEVWLRCSNSRCGNPSQRRHVRLTPDTEGETDE